MNEKKLKIAVQKSGRLNEDSINLLKKCGIKFNNGLGKLRAEAHDFPVEDLENVIIHRKLEPLEDSYTSKLFTEGINRVARKVGEEAVALVI